MAGHVKKKPPSGARCQPWPKRCKHPMLLLGTHEDFRKGWLCPDCEQFLLNTDLCDRGVIFAAFLIPRPAAQRRREGER